MHACTAIRNSDRVVGFGVALSSCGADNCTSSSARQLLTAGCGSACVVGTPGLSPSDLVFSCYLNAYLGLVDPTCMPSKFCSEQARDSLHVIERGVRAKSPKSHLPCSWIVLRVLACMESYCERGW